MWRLSFSRVSRVIMLVFDCGRRCPVSCSPLEGDCRPPRRQTATGPCLRGSGFFLRDTERSLRAIEVATLCVSARRCHSCARGTDLTVRMADNNRRMRNGLDHPDSCRDLHRAGDQRLSAGRVLSSDALAAASAIGAPDRHRARLGGGWGFPQWNCRCPTSAVWHGPGIRACGRGRRQASPLPPMARTGY